MDRGQILELVWGTTLGLALVNYFAFRVAGRMVTNNELPERAGAVAAAQLSGAAIVAGVVTAALVLTPTQSELGVAKFVVAATTCFKCSLASGNCITGCSSRAGAG